MAINSENKSRSALGLPTFILFPIADDGINPSDSRHVIWFYRFDAVLPTGISYETIILKTVNRDITLKTINRDIVLDG